MNEGFTSRLGHPFNLSVKLTSAAHSELCSREKGQTPSASSCDTRLTGGLGIRQGFQDRGLIRTSGYSIAHTVLQTVCDPPLPYSPCPVSNYLSTHHHRRQRSHFPFYRIRISSQYHHLTSPIKVSISIHPNSTLL